ncbi:hypothetical protein ACFQ67_23090 [Streptomyces sp. NPDC056488]
MSNGPHHRAVVRTVRHVPALPASITTLVPLLLFTTGFFEVFRRPGAP